MSDHGYKVGDEIETYSGKFETIDSISGDEYWTTEFPRSEGHYSYSLSRLPKKDVTVPDLGETTGMDPLSDLDDLTIHPTGAKRENKEGKGDQHLLFVGFPYTLTELAKHMENPLGRNWEKGLPVSSYANAAIRHLMGFLSGDPEPHHLRAAIWNMMCLSETVHRVEIGMLPTEVDDVDRTQRSKMNGGT